MRRYEFYKYAGQYDDFDPQNPQKQYDHHAIFGVGDSDSLPGIGDLGNYLGAQNAAANLNVAAAVNVAEPATGALLMMGLGMLCAVSGRRRASALQG